MVENLILKNRGIIC